MLTAIDIVHRIERLLEPPQSTSLKAEVQHLVSPQLWLAWLNYAYKNPCNDEVISIEKAFSEKVIL